MEHEDKSNGSSPGSAYTELRRLIVGPEREELDHLHIRLTDPELKIADVSEVLPDAIKRSAAKDGALSTSLRPLLEDAIRVSVQKHPEILAQALFPIIGTAVRKAVSNALQSMVQSLNQIVEHSVSLRSVGWRLEALRTGKSFGEIVLLRSMLYRVEQVFLIHRETGLLLQQRVADSVVIKNPDLVSGMLTAIQDFVRDSFGGQDDQKLETLRVGDFDVWIQYGPHAILAAVIRGTPPRQLEFVFTSALQNIWMRNARELENFDGDTSHFISCQEDLKACFLGQGPEHTKSGGFLWGIVATVLMIALGAWIVVSWRERAHWQDYVNRVRAQPGVVVTSAEKHDGNYHLEGLRDPLAVDPATLLEGSGLNPSQVQFHWEPYHSLQPAFETARRMYNEKLAIESQVFHFPLDSFRLPVEELGQVDDVARRILVLLDSAAKNSRGMTVELVGHTDVTGTEARNERLGLDRAEEVRSALISSGVPARLLTTRSAGASAPSRNGSDVRDQAFNRGVSIRVTLQTK
jgi:OOP family OmpA-OmpF porin